MPGVAQFDAFRPSISQGDSRPRSSRTGSSFDLGSFLTLLRVVCDFPEAMWGVLQQAISTLDVDFPADAAEHFECLLSNATTPAFERVRREARGTERPARSPAPRPFTGAEGRGGERVVTGKVSRPSARLAP